PPNGHRRRPRPDRPGVDPLSPAAAEPGVATVVDLRLGDRLTLRKPHPCGGHDWTVVPTGADIGITCDRCGRRVLIARSELEPRIMTHGRSDEMPSGSDP